MKPRGAETRRANKFAPAERVGDVLGDVLQRVDPEQLLPAYRIWTFWNDEMGEAIARRAQPSRFGNGILSVTVATHSWMQELQFMKENIRERLNARLGAAVVRDIFFVSGALEPARAADSASARWGVVSGESVVPLPPIADPALAAAFARIVAARARRVTRPSPRRASRKRPTKTR